MGLGGSGFRGGEFGAIIPPSAWHRATYPDDSLWKQPLRHTIPLTRPPMSKNRRWQILDLYLQEIRRRPPLPRHLNPYPQRANRAHPQVSLRAH
jgi:hypothetical protein